MTALVTLLTLLVAPAQAQDHSDGQIVLNVLENNLVLQPTARVQVWSTAFDMDEDPQADPSSYGDPEADIGFSIRRARIGLTGNMGGTFWRVSMGTGAPYDGLSTSEDLIQIVDAYGGYRFGEKRNTTIAAGIVPVPFARETLMSSLDLTFKERGVGTIWTSPIRDVGVMFDTTQGIFRGRAGVYNGNGNILGDNNDGVMGAARVELASGDTYRTYSPDGEAAYGVALSALYNDDISTNTLGLNADALARVGPITATVGITRNATSPKDDLIAAPTVVSDTTAIGFTGQLSAGFPLLDGGLEIAARYSSLDDATQLKDNGDVSIVHVGANFHDIAPGIDLGAGYILRLERQGRSVNNDTVRIWTQFRFPLNDRSGELL
jgi:hypothetical protein